MSEDRTYNQQLLEEFCVALKIDKEKDIFIFDPSVLHVPDVQALGIKNCVRVRRPNWGRGDIDNFFKIIPHDELKNLFTIEETSDEGNE